MIIIILKLFSITSTQNMHHQWYLSYSENHLSLNEPGLLLHKKRNGLVLRSWIGPMAHMLMSKLLRRHHPDQARLTNNGWQLPIDKQQAQHLLIEASFQQQFCLHHYQVTGDLLNHGLPPEHFDELLLYLRMSLQHPSHQSLIQVMSLIQPDNHRNEEQLETLEQYKLIQRISHNNTCFYDKNPLPHAHLYDPKSHMLYDHHCQLDDSGLQLIRC
ncbi:hypothetical protein ACFODZ_14245 [Marinicella sediminis]|uniref:Uncharacterized protein n=2 Tax=Marinicella sediminis TaxID=1792834 RepID=A0ABV7JH42_9GAMM|nr:hypothetical protein [Marinicella sediminis]